LAGKTLPPRGSEQNPENGFRIHASLGRPSNLPSSFWKNFRNPERNSKKEEIMAHKQSIRHEITLNTMKH